MSGAPVKFRARKSVGQVEEGNDLAPKFDERGLITYAHRSEYIADNADPVELVDAALRAVAGRGDGSLAGKGVV